jgi:hypothetical protein
MYEPSFYFPNGRLGPRHLMGCQWCMALWRDLVWAKELHSIVDHVGHGSFRRVLGGDWVPVAKGGMVERQKYPKVPDPVS